MIPVQASPAATAPAPQAALAQTGANGGFAGLLGLAADQQAADTEPALPPPTDAPPTSPAAVLGKASVANGEATSADQASASTTADLPPVLLALRKLLPGQAEPVGGALAVNTTNAASTSNSSPSGATLTATSALPRLLIRGDAATAASTPQTRGGDTETATASDAEAKLATAVSAPQAEGVTPPTLDGASDPAAATALQAVTPKTPVAGPRDANAAVHNANSKTVAQTGARAHPQAPAADSLAADRLASASTQTLAEAGTTPAGSDASEPEDSAAATSQSVIDAGNGVALNQNPLMGGAAATITLRPEPANPDSAPATEGSKIDRSLLPAKAGSRSADRNSELAAVAGAAPAGASASVSDPGLSSGGASADGASATPTLSVPAQALPHTHGSNENMTLPAAAASDNGLSSSSLASLAPTHHHAVSAPTSGSDASASGSALSTPLPADADLPEALGERVLMLSEAGVSSARIELHPAELGSLVVRIEIHNDQAQVAFSADNPATRSLLQQAMPQLRELFGTQGLQLMRTRVEERQRDGGSSTSASAGFAMTRGRGDSTAVRRIGRIRLVDAYV